MKVDSMDRSFDKVLVRRPGKSYENCVSKNPESKNIDPKEAKNQHENYVNTLTENNIEVIKLPIDESHPDSIFTQDAALVGEKTERAVICRFGEPTRRGEEKSIEKHLNHEGYEIKNIEAPGTLEGGDILVTDKDKIFVGVSDRTNEEGIEQLAIHFPKKEVIKVPVSKVFHLLSGVNFLGDGTLAICPDIVDLEYFEDFELIIINKDEQETRYKNKPINMISIGGRKVLLPEAYPKTAEILSDHGYKPVQVKITEFWKGDAGITCPMLPFYKDI